MSTSTIRRMTSFDDPEMTRRASELNAAVDETERTLADLYRCRALEAQNQYKQGHPMQVIATRFGVSRQTVHGWIKSLEDRK